MTEPLSPEQVQARKEFLAKKFLQLPLYKQREMKFYEGAFFNSREFKKRKKK